MKEWHHGNTQLFLLQISEHRPSKSIDGSLWLKGTWREGVLVTLRQIAGKKKRGDESSVSPQQQVMCVEYFLGELDRLRFVNNEPYLSVPFILSIYLLV